MNTFDNEPQSRKPRRFAGLRASFLTGLVVIAPVMLTFWLIWSFIGWVDGFVLPFIPRAYQPDTIVKDIFGPEASFNIRGAGVVFFFIFTIIIGWIAKGLIGRSLIHFGESLVDRTPVVRTIYNGVKQIAETVFAQTERSFERACLVEYPRRGIWAIGFISIDAKGEINRRVETSNGLVSVFLPTTPNPTSGFLLFVPADDIIELDMTVEDAAKLVISAGLVYPNPKGSPIPPPD